MDGYMCGIPVCWLYFILERLFIIFGKVHLNKHVCTPQNSFCWLFKALNILPKFIKFFDIFFWMTFFLHHHFLLVPFLFLFWRECQSFSIHKWAIDSTEVDSKKLSRLLQKSLAKMSGFTLILTPTDLNALSLRITFWCLVHRYALRSIKYKGFTKKGIMYNRIM